MRRGRGPGQLPLGLRAAALTRQFSQRRLERFCLEEEAVFLAGLSLGLELGRG